MRRLHVFPYQRNNQWCRRNQLNKNQVENSQSDKDGDRVCYFVFNCRDVEDENSQNGDKGTRCNQIDCVEKSLAPNCQFECYVDIEILSTAS